MCIPTDLVKAINCGDASYKTWSFGYSSSGFLPVRGDTYIVIIGFRFWHFIDLFTEDLEDISEVWLRSVKQIRFRSKKSNSKFIIRQPIRTISLPIPPPFNVIFDTWGSTSYDNLYLLHEENVAIDVINSPQELVNLLSASRAISATEKPRSPASFGTEATAPEVTAFTQQYVLGGGGTSDTMEIFPLGKDLTDPLFLPPLTPNAADQIEYPVNDFSQSSIVELGLGRASRMVPIVDIQYVEINKEATWLQSSSN